MSKIMVYKSDTDGKLFEDINKYRIHLKKLAKQRRVEKNITFHLKEKNAFIKNMCDEIGSVKELVEFIVNNQKWFITNGRLSSFDKLPENIKIDDLAISSGYDDESGIPSLRWNNHVGNTHCAPIGKKTNWGGRVEGEPRSYHGWNAVITFSVTLNSRHSLSSEMFKGTPLNMGSGGTGKGSNGYRYTMDLFAVDFKKMAYGELLNDFISGNELDLDRVSYVLKTSKKYIDWDSEVFLNMVNYIYDKNPILGAEILKEKLEHGITRVDKLGCRLKI